MYTYSGGVRMVWFPSISTTQPAFIDSSVGRGERGEREGRERGERGERGRVVHPEIGAE